MSTTTDQPTIQQVADGVWAYVQPDGTWMINNTGLIAREGDAGATFVDVTSTEKRTRAFLEAADGVLGGRDVSRVVLTHSHPDHCNGLSLVPDAEVIAQRRVHADLSTPHVPAPGIFSPFEMGDIRARTPSIVFDDVLVLEPGDAPIEVRHPGRSSHTTGDAYVWLPTERVLFTGDLVFNGGTPFGLSGSLSGWLQTLDELAALGPATVVPGHGPVGGPEILDPVRSYLAFVLEASESAHARGASPLDAARELDLGEFAGLADSERIVGNVHSAMAELSGTPLDAGAAWSDMRDYNGGPLDCHA
ncbi:MAG: MBL fold metallo-hydrolase [Pseudoclavibacter sp.]